MQRAYSLFLLFLIFGLAAFFRFYGLNWDQGQGMHPDERFLAMVTNDSKLPESFSQYLDPQNSTLNPYNFNFNFFVYGTLPVNLNKFLISYFMEDNYGNIFLFGRTLSALFDLSALIAVYLLARLLATKFELSNQCPLWAAFTYCVLVLPIQHAHFFTTDSFLNAFLTWSLYFALQSHFSPRSIWVVLAGIIWGLALACKVSALYSLPLVLALIVVSPSRSLHPKDIWSSIFSSFLDKSFKVLTFALFAYLFLRLGDPRFFAYGSFLDPTINPKFIANIRELQAQNDYTGGIPFPPAVQWINKPDFTFALMNIVVFGAGIAASLLSLIGLSMWRRWTSNTFLLIVGWAVCFYLYQSSQFAKSLRYFYVLYPLIALSAGFAASALLGKIRNLRLLRIAAASLVCALLIWPEMFRAIYKEEHSRVQASRWIYQNIPAGSVLGNIHWDDGLPLHLPDIERVEYRSIELPVFGPDDDHKWQQLERAYAKLDYMILSSNRGYGSMMPQPELFPRTARFYEDLFAERLNYTKVAQFSAFPTLRLFGLEYEYDDQWSEEAFTVYDHPLVTIFKRTSG